VAQLKEAVAVCAGCRSQADLHKNLGLIYCRSGNVKGGLTELRIAQRLKANDPDIETALRVLHDAQQSPPVTR
jgi:hypothetical protein